MSEPEPGNASRLMRSRDVRFGSKADIGARPINVCFTPESGHRNRHARITFDAAALAVLRYSPQSAAPHPVLIFNQSSDLPTVFKWRSKSKKNVLLSRDDLDNYASMA